MNDRVTLRCGGQRRGQGDTVKRVDTDRYKTELCRAYQESASCRYGERCQFAHGLSELRVVPRHPKYKTDLCRTFHSTGLCPYGSRCHFIHGQDSSPTRYPISVPQSDGNSDIEDSRRASGSLPTDTDMADVESVFRILSTLSRTARYRVRQAGFSADSFGPFDKFFPANSVTPVDWPLCADADELMLLAGGDRPAVSRLRRLDSVSSTSSWTPPPSPNSATHSPAKQPQQFFNSFRIVHLV